MTEKDVSGLIQISVRKLQEMRELGIKPPVWIKIGASVRYPAALLKQWIESGSEMGHASAPSTASSISKDARSIARPSDSSGYDEPLFRGGRRKKVKHQNFAQFLSEGHLPDEWLFVLRGPHRRPVDWMSTLADKERCDEDEVVWLELGDYLGRLEHSAGAEGADEVKAKMESVMDSGKPHSKEQI